jgi:hypothetical protein
MERLKIVLIIAAMVATARTSPGQQPSQFSSAGATANHAQSTFVVIGDVRNHNYFPLSPHAKTTIHQAVIHAGMLGDSVSVSVVRGKQQRAAFTQMVSGASADTGELVMAGDILVVQSMQPVQEALQKNAALQTEGGVVPVTLADDYIAVGDVLQGTGGLPSADQQVKVSCRFRGRPLLENAALSDRVEHGDVITVVHRAQSTARGFGSMVPAFSEWQTSEVTQPAPAALSAAENLVPEVAPASPLEFPVQGSETTIPDDSRNPFAAPSEPEPADDAALESNTETEQNESELTVRSVSQAATVPSENIAPPAPVEIAVPLEAARQVPAASMGLWNILFIGGLLVAGSMILIGSLRSEDESLVSETSAVQYNANSENVAGNFAAAMSPSIEQVTVQAPAVSEKKFTAPAPVVVAAVPTKSLLASENLPSATETQAWFGGDWRSSEARASVSSIASEQAASCDSVIVAAGIDHRGQVDSPSIYLMEKMVVESLSDSKSVRPVKITESIAVEQNATPVVPTTKPIAAIPIAVAVEPEIRSSVPIRPIASESVVNTAKGLSDLEDLLQNRLPIDLCQVELPLRVSLFGRPAGPRRLRIDAAHSRVPAPHMNMSSERRRDEAVTVSAQRSAFEMPSQEEQAGEKKSAATSASLDRALHYLQDRTDT